MSHCTAGDVGGAGRVARLTGGEKGSSVSWAKTMAATPQLLVFMRNTGEDFWGKM